VLAFYLLHDTPQLLLPVVYIPKLPRSTVRAFDRNKTPSTHSRSEKHEPRRNRIANNRHRRHPHRRPSCLQRCRIHCEMHPKSTPLRPFGSVAASTYQVWVASTKTQPCARASVTACDVTCRAYVWHGGLLVDRVGASLFSPLDGAETLSFFGRLLLVLGAAFRRLVDVFLGSLCMD